MVAGAAGVGIVVHDRIWFLNFECMNEYIYIEIRIDKVERCYLHSLHCTFVKMHCNVLCVLFNFGKLVHDSNEMKTLHLSCATKVIKGWTEAMPLMVGSQTNGCWWCPEVKTYQLYLQIGTKASGFLHKVFTWIMCSYLWH